MQTIEPGETWTISLGGTVRDVRVIGEGDPPGWWRCVDLEFEVEFAARIHWFVERLAASNGGGEECC